MGINTTALPQENSLPPSLVNFTLAVESLTEIAEQDLSMAFI